MTQNQIHPEYGQLQAYLDEVLNEQETRQLESHLESCPACREELSHQELLISRLEGLPEVSLSRDLSRVVISQLKEERKLSSRITWALVLEALAAGTVLAALIPIIQAATWLPTLVDTRQELLVAANIFLTQLASTWIIWWERLQLTFKVTLDPVFNQVSNPSLLLPAWILILAAGGAGILINLLLLRFRPAHPQHHQS